MTDDDETESDDRMGRADRIRSTREGRRSQSRRSRSDTDADESASQQTENQSSQTSQREQTSQRNEKTTGSQPVKDRPHRTVYLPSNLDDELDSQIDRIQYEAKHETEGEKVQLAKNRHVYPLIVHLGLERANNMTIDELLATLTDTDMLDTPDHD